MFLAWGVVAMVSGCPDPPPASEPPACEVTVSAGSQAPAGPVGAAGGVVVLPNGRRLTPKGRQVGAGTFLNAVAESADGRFLYVLDSGYRGENVLALDVARGEVVSTLPAPRGQHGLVATQDGRYVLVSGGYGNSLVRISAADGQLAPDATMALGNAPLALAMSDDGAQVAVAQHDGKSILLVETATLAVTKRLSGLPGSPYAVAWSRSSAHVVALELDRGRAVSVAATTGVVVNEVDVGKNPSWVARARDTDTFAAVAADSDRLVVLDLDPAGRLSVRHDVPLGEGVDGKRGRMPTSVEFAPGGERIYVALSAANEVAVVSASQGTVLGRIPVGWYPSALAVSADGRTLYVANAKGAGMGANANAEYIGNLFSSTVSLVPIPDDATLAAWTAEAIRCWTSVSRDNASCVASVA